MRRAPVILCLLVPSIVLGAGLPASQTWMPKVPGTIALYQFDEGSGTVAADASGNGYTATLVGGPAWEAGLGGGGAIHCGATDAYVQTPAIPIGDSWTVQAWTRFPLDISVQGWRTLFKHGESQHHVLVSATGDLGTYVGGFEPSGYNVGLLTGWHLLTAVGSGGSTTFYIDAQQVGVSPDQETLDILAVGNNEPSGQNWGPIDSFRVVSGARSAADIARDANPLLPAPQGLVQTDMNGAAIPAGGSAHGGFVAKLTPGQGFSSNVTVEVEVKPAGTAFDGATGVYSAVDVLAGQVAVVPIAGLGSGPRHWRARSVDAISGASPWASFGTTPELDSEADLVMVNSAPTASGPSQSQGGDGLPAEASRPVMDTAGIVFRVATTDSDGDLVRLQVELRPSGEAFTGDVTAEGPAVRGGQPAECLVVTDPGTFQWSYRVIDALGATSSWTRYGAGTSPDFEVEWQGSQGPACGGSALGGGGALAGLAVLLIVARRPLQ